MNSPLFSIIIPHYNIPDLLMRCLKSIPVSEDIQVIVVDDNSPDADTYLERYPELSRPYLEFIRTTKGGGAGYARNVGLDHAKGKWLLFADADDFFVEKMFDIISSHVGSEADVVFFKKKGVLSEDINCELKNVGHVNEILDTFLQTGDEWPIRTRHFVPWGKMIRHSLIAQNNIRFDEVQYANDCFFSVLIGYYAHRIEGHDTVLYYKTDRQGSLSAALCTKPNELRTRADVFFRIDVFLLQHGVCRERQLTNYLIRMLKNDRSLYRYYFNNRLNEVYPSRFAAIKDICKGYSLVVQASIFLYSLLIWKKL